MAETIKGFPWSNIPRERFDSFKLSLREVNATQAQDIVRLDWSENMPYLLHGGYTKFDSQFLMALYFRSQPLGFVSGGTFKFGGQKAGEVGMVYSGLLYRGKGAGTILTNLGSLRVLSMKPEVLYSHIKDETGIIRALKEEQSFIYVGENTQSRYPEWKRELNTPEDKKDLMAQLVGGINRGLKKFEENLPYFRLMTP